MTDILDQLIPLADAHQKADEYVSGRYDWHNGACAIGCTIHDAKNIGVLSKRTKAGDHKNIAAALGTSEYVMRMCDNVFEGLADVERPAWTPRFLRALKKGRGVKHELIHAEMAVWLMCRLEKEAIREDVREVAKAIVALYRRRAAGDEPTGEEWDAAWRQADAAWQQAEAARQQAYAARRQAEAAWQQADAAWRQADAAWRQAEAAWQQADAARQHADAARQQAEAAWQQAEAAWQQADAARQQFWCDVGDELCRLLSRRVRAGKDER